MPASALDRPVGSSFGDEPAPLLPFGLTRVEATVDTLQAFSYFLDQAKSLDKYPTVKEFELMGTQDKYKIFTGLPIPAQKLLVACSAFTSSVRPDMVKPVSKTTDEEFEGARATLLETPFFSQTETGRLDVAQPMRDFINTDLKII